MNTTDLLVIALGLAAIVWVNWYFFFAANSTARAEAVSGGFQEVTVRVAAGYDPAHIQVAKGSPLRLIFDRQETSSCSEEVVFPDFGIKKFLPAHKKTTIELRPDRAGTYSFTCGMSMLRGTLTVVDEKEG